MSLKTFFLNTFTRIFKNQTIFEIEEPDKGYYDSDRYIEDIMKEIDRVDNYYYGMEEQEKEVIKYIIDINHLFSEYEDVMSFEDAFNNLMEKYLNTPDDKDNIDNLLNLYTFWKKGHYSIRELGESILIERQMVVEGIYTEAYFNTQNRNLKRCLINFI